MLHILEDLRTFLDASPTAWHASIQLSNRFAARDFIPLSEGEKWELEPNKSYFVFRDGSLCAFRMPSSSPSKLQILASHTDSPALKLKPHPEQVKENLLLLGTEVYGSPLLSSWLNRDLALAGKVVFEDLQDQLVEKVIFIDDAPLFIPQLPVHLDKEINEKGLLLNKQDHLLPIAAIAEKKDAVKGGYVEQLIRRHFSFKRLISFDLFLVPLEGARFLGGSGEFIASYRIDNLASCHAAASALASAHSTDTLQLSIFYDCEEIGSRTYSGASSTFLSDVLKRLSLFWQINPEEEQILKHNSLCVSIDMAHAFNPNYAAKFDPNHLLLPGRGIAIKHSAEKRYATSASSSSKIIQICHALNIPFQPFAMRSDLISGSTIGPIIAQNLGIDTVDIGIVQFSMHSSREVMACEDHLTLCNLLTKILEDSQ